MLLVMLIWIKDACYDSRAVDMAGLTCRNDLPHKDDIVLCMADMSSCMPYRESLLHPYGDQSTVIATMSNA